MRLRRCIQEHRNPRPHPLPFGAREANCRPTTQFDPTSLCGQRMPCGRTARQRFRCGCPAARRFIRAAQRGRPGDRDRRELVAVSCSAHAGLAPDRTLGRQCGIRTPLEAEPDPLTSPAAASRSANTPHADGITQRRTVPTTSNHGPAVGGRTARTCSRRAPSPLRSTCGELLPHSRWCAARRLRADRLASGVSHIGGPAGA